MSWLIDALNRVARVTAQPMGFGAARSASSEPRLLLVASLALGSGTGYAESAKGADAVLLRPAKSALTAKTLQEIGGSLPDLPWGGWVADISAKKTETMIAAGCDFVVFPAASRVVDTSQGDSVGRILQVEASLDDGLLRAVNDLPVDAVLAAEAYQDGSLAWHHLMRIQHLANLVTKPLLVPAPLNMPAGELKSLWEAGVDGVVAEVDTGQPGGLKELRQLINELPPRSARKRDKAEALLPHIGGESQVVTPDEEEEEEEE